MCFRWASQEPVETLDYRGDWSRVLGSATRNSVKWFVKSTQYSTKTELGSCQTLTVASSSATTDSIQNVSQTNTTTVATINIAGGQNNIQYTFSCQMTDDTGTTAERSIKLRVKER